MRGGEGQPFCEAAMATGPFNEKEHAVTNDIPEPIGYTANGQFTASLKRPRVTTHNRAHRGALPLPSHWSDLIEYRTLFLCFCLHESICDK